MKQNTSEQFNAQLQEGQYNELRVALHFMLQGAHVKIGFQNQSHDISVWFSDGTQDLIEVKWDKRAAQTRNLFFETRNTRKNMPSGIFATTATRWCHVIGDGKEALLAPVSVLKKILEQGQYRTTKTSGSDSNSEGIIVPLKTLSNQQGIEWITLPTEKDFFGNSFAKQVLHS